MFTPGSWFLIFSKNGIRTEVGDDGDSVVGGLSRVEILLVGDGGPGD
jgi:hypothetical protein